MRKALLTILVLLMWLPGAQGQEHHGHHGHRMSLDASGMTMNENSELLPRDCEEITARVELTVHAGRQYAKNLPGMMFAYSENEFEAGPCSLVTVTLVNDDEVRHQWMIHGLPRYLYPGGMFHLETAGGTQRSGSFIVPGDAQTYLVHCDMPQHMEKGMKAQLVIAGGSGDLWAVPNTSDALRREDYLDEKATWLSLGVFAASVLLGMVILGRV